MSQENTAGPVSAIFDESGQLIYAIPSYKGIVNSQKDQIVKIIQQKKKGRSRLLLEDREEWLEIVPVNFRDNTMYLCMCRYRETINYSEGGDIDLVQKSLELDAIFEASHDGIVVADDKGRYLRINKNYENLTGIPPKDLIGLTSHEIVEKGFVSDSPTYKVIETGKPQSLTQVFRSGRMSHITATPVFKPDGELFRVVVNIRDTTELIKLREKLSSSNKKLDQYAKIISSLSTKEGDQIFSSPSMLKIKSLAIRFAQVDAHLLLVGETGVGKEVITDLVYKYSNRKTKPFIKINCSAIPEALLESQLFGYEEGAFTGAKREGCKGLIEMAEKGTVFLDEISEIPLNLQVKLLRFIQQKEFYRVGGKELRKVDVRIIAATNRNLEEMVEKNEFRSDLYYRLNVLKLDIPPLRERKEEIYPLAMVFLSRCNKRYGLDKTFSPSLSHLLMDYDWPGNVRELENMVERMVLVSTQDEILPCCLPLNICSWQYDDYEQCTTTSTKQVLYRQAQEQFESTYWQEALNRYGSCRKTALATGVDHSTVVKKVARYNLETTKSNKTLG